MERDWGGGEEGVNIVEGNSFSGVKIVEGDYFRGVKEAIDEKVESEVFENGVVVGVFGFFYDKISIAGGSFFLGVTSYFCLFYF